MKHDNNEDGKLKTIENKIEVKSQTKKKLKTLQMTVQFDEITCH